MNSRLLFLWPTLCALLLAGCAEHAVPVAPNADSGLPTTLSGYADERYRVAYAFTGDNSQEAPNPSSPLVLLNGVLYGTTRYGGSNVCSYSQGRLPFGCGTLFSISQHGAFKTLHSFSADANGYNPSELTNVNGTLYGVAETSTFGVLFTISPSGNEQIVYRFKGGRDGWLPSSFVASGGSLYGVTAGGGNSCSPFSSLGCGMVYKLTRPKNGAYVETVLHRFTGGRDAFNGGVGLAVLDGNIYGSTTDGGGASGCGSTVTGCGTVFRVTPSGSYNVIHRFTSFADGQYPAALYAFNGVLFGLTESGGAHQCGSFFSMTADGNKKTLYSFKGNTDGCTPYGQLINIGGQFYGTTTGYGTPYQLSGDFGTVFAISPAGAEHVLYNFGKASQGAIPTNGVTEVNSREVFGTTYFGGSRTCLPKTTNGCGVIFALEL
jgi:uncharacterized repeat protein (TIGR03803 family)